MKYIDCHQHVFGHLNEEHFSVKDAAAFLEISLTTLRRYVSTKKIKPVKVIGRSPLFSAIDLRQLKTKNGVKYANTRCSYYPGLKLIPQYDLISYQI